MQILTQTGGNLAAETLFAFKINYHIRAARVWRFLTNSTSLKQILYVFHISNYVLKARLKSLCVFLYYMNCSYIHILMYTEIFFFLCFNSTGLFFSNAYNKLEEQVCVFTFLSINLIAIGGNRFQQRTIFDKDPSN